MKIEAWEFLEYTKLGFEDVLCSHIKKYNYLNHQQLLVLSHLYEIELTELLGTPVISNIV